MEPPYVSHNGGLINTEPSFVSVDSPFMHHEALHVRGGGVFLCHKWVVVSDNTKYPVEGFTIV